MNTNFRRLGAVLALGIGLQAGLAHADDQTITIAYQTGYSPFVLAVASGEIEKIPGWNVEFRQFNSGAEIFAAIASGDVQIGDVGSSPLAASISNGIDVRLIYITGAAGQDEALVARNGSGIESLADLRGKRVAAAPVSTDHFMLLSTLKQEGIGADEATVLAIPQPEIVAGWKRGDIDAAFVWDPALSTLLEDGKILITAEDAAERGAVTFVGLAATTELVDSNPQAVQQFIDIVDKYYRDLETDSDGWTVDSEPVQTLAKFTGAPADEIAARIAVSNYVPAAEQASAVWLGGGDANELSVVLLDTAQFLKGEQKIPRVLDSYTAFLDPRFVENVRAAY